MGYDRFPRDVLPDPGSQRIAEDGTVPGAHPAFFRTQPAYEDDFQGRASNQPTTNYPSEYPPPRATSNLDMYCLEDEENRYGSTSLCPPPSATYLNSHSPTVRAHGVWNGLDSEQEPHDNATRMSHSAAGPSRAIPRAIISPRGAGQHPYIGMYGPWYRGSRRWPDPGSPEHSYMGYGVGNAPANARSAPPSFNSYSSISGGASHGNQFPVMNEHILPVPPLTHTHNPGIYSHPTVIRNTFTSAGFPTEARSDRHNPHAEARPYHTQGWSGSTITSAGPSGERTGVLGHAEFLDLHTNGDGGVGDEGCLAELPPELRSDGLPSQPTGAQRRRSTRKTKQTASPDKAVLAQKRRRRRKPGGVRDFTKTEPPAFPAVTHGSTRIALVPQTPYTCTRQDDWIQQTPIKFWGVKLTDAANPGYLGLRDFDDKVLNYEGVGSSISCRLNSSGNEIGKLKILTTNHKRNREHITRKKLAFEVAKLVRDHIEGIRAEPGCQDITFENLVLTRLFHVSRASWQPELWYEVPVQDSGPS